LATAVPRLLARSAPATASRAPEGASTSHDRSCRGGREYQPLTAAAAHARDLRAQLFSLRRTLLAPDLALEAAVEIFEEFLLIGSRNAFTVAGSRGAIAFCHAAASSRSAAAILASAQVASSRAVRAVRQSNDDSAAASGVASEGANSNSGASGTTVRSMRRSVIFSAAGRAA
jgi:hypothetical protein